MTQLKCIKGLTLKVSEYEAFIVGNIYPLFEDESGKYTTGETEYITEVIDGEEVQTPLMSKHYIPEPFKSEYFTAL